MNIKRLSARVIAVFAAVLLITALSVPAFAATENIIAYDPENDSGMFRLEDYATYMYGDIRFLSPETFSAVLADYPYFVFSGTPLYDGAPCAFINFFDDIGDGSFVREECKSLSFQYNPNSGEFGLTALKDSTATFYLGSEVLFSNFDLYDPYGRGLISAAAPITRWVPSISDIVTPDIFPNVFNEIISLFPIALGVLVGYIAIRKGISYLQSFLHNS